MPAHVIVAAGGIVTRRTDGGDLEVLLVHRLRYDDWSFPKGKVDPPETEPEAALREVREETGMLCTLGAEAGSVEYRDGSGEPKRVTYWVMTTDGGEFSPNDEVDRIEWRSIPDAMGRLTYVSDRSLLGRLDAVAD